jgi:Leucine-rich repeat (LRR) protein/ankyrin repeat protein
MDRFLPGFIAIALFWGVAHLYSASPDTQLREGVRNGNLSEVEDSYLADSRPESHHHRNTLFIALENQYRPESWEIVQSLLKHGASLSSTNFEGETAWIVMLKTLHKEEQCLPLLAFKPDLRAMDKDGNGTVVLACGRGWIQLAEKLLQAGVPVDVPNKEGRTALMTAAEISPELVRLLLSFKADPRVADRTGKRASDFAYEKANYDALLILDTDKKYESQYPEILKKQRDQKLARLIEMHNSRLVAFNNKPKPEPIDTLGQIRNLLKEGADANSITSDRQSTILGRALGHPTERGGTAIDPALVSLLLEQGADPNQPQPGQEKDLPIVLALSNGDAFDAVLSKGADFRRKIEQTEIRVEGSPLKMISVLKKVSLLHLAAERGTPAMIEKLVAKGLDLNEPDEAGFTPLMHAVTQGNSNATRWFLAHGAKTDLRSTGGVIVADLAAQSFDISTLRLLDKEGKYSDLLREFNPDTKSPVVGEWMLKFPQGSLRISLFPDGGASFNLRGLAQAAGWKATGVDRFEIISTLNMKRGYPLRQRFEMKLVFNPLERTLTADWGGSTLVYRRPDDSSVAVTEPIRESPRKAQPVSTVADDIAAAKVSNNPNLTISDYELKEIPPEVGQIMGLTYLQIVNTKIENVPGFLGRLTLLDNIGLRANRLVTIEEGFFDLPNLKELDLSSNRFKKLPEKVSGLKSLESLALSDNLLETLPDIWDQLPELNGLSVNENRLKTLPVSLARAKKLRRLHLGNNLLSDLPGTWAEVPLDSLSIEGNRFTAIPAVALKMEALTYLGLAHNDITEISPEFQTNRSLLRIDLSENLVKTIPNLGQTHLESLDLSGNQITQFPSGKEFFPSSLRELNLAGNQITDVPAWIFDLNLRDLSLRGNPMPPEKIREIEKRIEDSFREKRKKKAS